MEFDNSYAKKSPLIFKVRRRRVAAGGVRARTRALRCDAAIALDQQVVREGQVPLCCASAGHGMQDVPGLRYEAPWPSLSLVGPCQPTAPPNPPAARVARLEREVMEAWDVAILGDQVRGGPDPWRAFQPKTQEGTLHLS